MSSSGNSRRIYLYSICALIALATAVILIFLFQRAATPHGDAIDRAAASLRVRLKKCQNASSSNKEVASRLKEAQRCLQELDSESSWKIEPNWATSQMTTGSPLTRNVAKPISNTARVEIETVEHFQAAEKQAASKK